MCGFCLRDTDNNGSDYITSNTLQDRGSQNKIDYWFSKYNRVLHHYSLSIVAAVVVGAC
jgi:hypothetical protein